MNPGFMNHYIIIIISLFLFISKSFNTFTLANILKIKSGWAIITITNYDLESTTGLIVLSGTILLIKDNVTLNITLSHVEYTGKSVFRFILRFLGFRDSSLIQEKEDDIEIELL